MSSLLPMPPANASVGDLLAAAWGVFRASLAKCLPIAMIAALIGEAPALLYEAQARGHDIKLMDMLTDKRLNLESAMALVLDALLFTLVILRMRSVVRGVTPNLSEELPRLMVRMPLLFPAVVLALLLIVVGFVLIVPGIYAIVCVSVLPAVVMFEDHTVLGAIRRSFVLMSKQWVRNFAVYVIGYLIATACIFFIALVLGIGMEDSAGSSPTIALEQALLVAFLGVMWTFLSSISLVLYTSASSSA